MTSKNLTGKLAHFSARRRWTVLGAWVVVLVAAFFVAGSIDDGTTNASTANPNLESGIGQALIDERINFDKPAEEFVMVEFETGTANDAHNRAFVAALAADLVALEDVTAVASYVDGNEGLVTADKKAALVLTTLSVADDEAINIIEPLLTVVEEANSTSGYRVTTVGQGSVENEFETLIEESLVKGEAIGIAFALVVLLVVFGAAVAAGLPILVAITSIIVAVSLSAIIGRVMDLDSEAVEFIIPMIGLAVGIDYSLFIVKRFSEELARGREKMDAITAAGNTAGRTIMISGFAVMIALTGMLIIPDVSFRSVGLAAIVVVIATMAAATTLLPAIISILGHRVYWLRIPFVGRKIVVGENKANANKTGVWDRVTNAVTARPLVSVIVTGGALIAVSSAVFTMNLGSNGITSLPEDSAVRHAFEVVVAEFSDGVISADIVIDSADATAPAILAGVESLEADLADDPFYGDTEVTIAPGNDLIVINAVMQGDYSGQEAEDALSRLRDQYVPAAFDGAADVYVTGVTAEVVDEVNLLKNWLPLVFGLVLGSSFLLLLIVFRSIVVPIKAVVMNLLSVGAAYGLMVLVFQHGIGADLLGFQQVPVIEYGLPLFLFSILFGLSMDYHVFMLSRIKEHYDETGDNKASVAFGLRSTAGIITGAALIMVGVFGGFALGDMVMMQQVGFGLAAAIIIDATLVRSVLVPASMVLLGDRNWYFPAWLEWLPRIGVEGEAGEAPESESQELEPATTTPLLAPATASEVVGD
ncbi:MAG: MMPL family transporter [Chloroflexi bacterium]|nr:MMPL family transporter [Chloroflexota bacterium]